MIDVVWLTLHDNVPNRQFWDQAIVEWLVAELPWPVTHRDTLPDDGSGAVVVLPGSAHRDDAAALSVAVSALPWVVLVVTGDEGSFFPAGQVDHPNLTLWIQNPRSDRHGPEVRWFPVGWSPHTALLPVQCPAKPQRWVFAGQVTHPRREQCVGQLRRLDGGTLIETAGFTAGVSPAEYMALLASAKVAPCPAGQVTPDTFRTWEALEAGCVPLVDRQSGEWDVPADYWTRLLGVHPLRVVGSWRHTPRYIDLAVDGWPASTVAVQAWWQTYKRDLSARFAADVAALSGQAVPVPPLTVLIPTSPIPSHPDTTILDTTIASVRHHLPDAPIVVMADGVRPEQADHTDTYSEYLRRLLWAANHRWTNVRIHVSPTHRHQSGLTSDVLADVDSSAVLFVEHDTPLLVDRPVPFGDIIDVLAVGEADVVRLHHEASVLDGHRHLMIDDGPTAVGDLPAWRTVQWSQRPHVASTSYYRRILADHFTDNERWMIEAKMHGVVQDAWNVDGEAGWARHRLWLYHPDGDIKRSTHLDGRGADPKWETS